MKTLPLIACVRACSFLSLQRDSNMHFSRRWGPAGPCNTQVLSAADNLFDWKMQNQPRHPHRFGQTMCRWRPFHLAVSVFARKITHEKDVRQLWRKFLAPAQSRQVFRRNFMDTNPLNPSSTKLIRHKSCMINGQAFHWFNLVISASSLAMRLRFGEKGSSCTLLALCSSGGRRDALSSNTR